MAGTQSDRRARRLSVTALAVGIIALLVAGLVGLAVLRARPEDAGPGGAGAGPGGTVGVSAKGFDATPRQTIAGQARSVEFEGRVLDLTTISLDSLDAADASGTVTDAAGRMLGSGRVETAGAVKVVGTGLTLTLSPTRFRPGQPAVATTDRRAGVESSGAVQLHGANLRFSKQTADGTAAPQVVAGPVSVQPEAGGTVTVSAFGARMRWVDPPAVMRIVEPSSGRATLSWAGEGTIETDRGPVTSGFLGLKAQRLLATLTTEAGRLKLDGQASLRQVYADGAPQLSTTAAAAIKEVRGAPAGGKAWFRWAPENRGQHDMTITRIRPGNADAAWVNLALDQLPAMCGGEQCSRVGGDTSGLAKRGSGGLFGIGSRSAQPIDAVILPGTGDESEVSFDIPAGAVRGRHVLVLILEGNFDPVTVEVAVEVT